MKLKNCFADLVSSCLCDAISLWAICERRKRMFVLSLDENITRANQWYTSLQMADYIEMSNNFFSSMREKRGLFLSPFIDCSKRTNFHSNKKNVASSTKIICIMKPFMRESCFSRSTDAVDFMKNMSFWGVDHIPATRN